MLYGVIAMLAVGHRTLAVSAAAFISLTVGMSTIYLDTHWLTGKFFHQPEVFFTRDIFARAGGHVSQDLYFSMDYDLWVRMAKAGARAFALPEILAIFREHRNQKTGGEHVPYLPELRAVNARHRAAL